MDYPKEGVISYITFYGFFFPFGIIAPLKSALAMLTPVMFAPLRSTPLKFAPVKLAWVKLASVSTASSKFAPLRLARVITTRVKSALVVSVDQYRFVKVGFG